MSDEKRKVNDRFKELQNEIAELRKKLDSVNEEKEKWFSKKEGLKKEISKIVNEARKLREEKDKINADVKKFKEERDKQNTFTKEKIERVKSLKDKINFKEKDNSPEGIKKEIESLELKIETEALSFANEKKLMKIISKLKQEYKKAKDSAETSDNKNKAEREIIDSKKKAEELHGKVQELAGKSKEKHNIYLEISRKIKEINSEQEKAFDNFLKFKEEFNSLSKNLNDKLDELKDSKLKIDTFKMKSKEEKEEAKKKILLKKVEDVEEKLKKGKKLTTEDLIRYQGSTE
ncbi:hypothetical protein HYT56_01655 [Candidatus Woesearchaeota archaeon]|nr:hypothetical protein [Candidatus Woesearchaeota archaeon]